jgi:hypothetical protein
VEPSTRWPMVVLRIALSHGAWWSCESSTTNELARARQARSPVDL